MKFLQSPWMLYLAAVNVAALALSFIKIKCFPDHMSRALDALLVALAVGGGSLGLVLCFALFDRRPRKENMTVIVAGLSLAVAEIFFALLLSRGPSTHFDPIGFFGKRPWLILYLVVMSVLTYSAFAVDKRRAIKGGRRVPIVTLLLLCALGGTPGGFAGMYGLRHKTKKPYFVLGLPMILLAQGTVLAFWMTF